MTALLGPAWAVLALVALSRLRPSAARRRARALRPDPPPHRRRREAAVWWPPVTIVERLGGVLLRLWGDRHRAQPPVDPALARRLGAVALCTGLLAVAPPVAALAAVLAWAVPPVRARRAERRRLAALEEGLPEVVDLLALAVGAGLSVPLAVASVSRRAPGPLAAELGRVTREVRMGRRLSDALDDLPRRAGEAVRPLVAALLAAERYGAPLGPGLERLSDDVRRRRRRAAEEAARRVPVRLLFPLVTCTLPAFALLTVAPLIASALRSLRL